MRASRNGCCKPRGRRRLRTNTAQKMRIAIVADIHGNRRAFEAVLADLKQVAPDLIVHGGDLASGGAYPAEIIDQIRTLGWPGIRGNTDEMLWAPETLAAFAAANPAIAPLLTKVAETIAPTVAMIGQERLRWLEQLPATHTQAGIHSRPRQAGRSVARPDAECQRRRIAKHLRIAQRSRRRVLPHSRSVRAPPCWNDRREYR